MKKTKTKQGGRILDFSYGLYNSILTLKFFEVAIKEFAKFVLLSKAPQKRRFFWERMGIFSRITRGSCAGKWIWIHANAIGEVNASRSLISLLKDKYPFYKVLLTTSNFSGDKKAAQLNIADAVMFFPHDMPFIIRRYLKIFDTACFIGIECDIWPNFIRICKDRAIPVLAVSSVYTDGYGRSLGLRYLYNFRFRMTKDVLQNIDCFCMQSEEDARRLSAAISGHKNISITGNLKFSSLNSKLPAEEKRNYQRVFNIKESDAVFVAGNIHPKEDEIVIEAFKLVKEEIPRSVMILAPRFLKDISSLESLLSKKRLDYIKRSQLDTRKRFKEDVILLDTMGELARVYSVAKAAFVGGSLVYLGPIFGGHNILEPAQFGAPVMFGPYMHNFQNLANLFLREKIGVQVKGARDLADNIGNLMRNEAAIAEIRVKAQGVFKLNEGVSEQTFNRLRPFLEVNGSAGDYPLKCEVCRGRTFKFILQQDKYKIFRCKNCRLVFSQPIPSEEQLYAFYQNFAYNRLASMYVRENEQIAKYVTWAQLKLLRRLGQDIHGGRFLDIGCGNGYYLYGAKAAGFEAVGVEKDEVAAEYARAHYGIEVKSNELDRCGFAENYFDIIKMRQLIEHLRYPAEYLQQVRRILKPGGILIIETANTDTLETIPRLYFLDAFKKIKASMPQLPLFKKILLSLRREWAFTDPPRHLYGFAKDNLERLLVKNGFRCLKTLTAVRGDKVHYPISQGQRELEYSGEKERLNRLWGKSRIVYCGYRFMFKPAMAIFRLYVRLFGLGSHLVSYAKKA